MAVFRDDDPIVALATPWGESAIAVIRTSGAGSVELVAGLFDPSEALAGAPSHSLTRGAVVDPAGGEPVDDVLAAVFRSPRGYTGEDAVEIYCHGGTAVISRLLEVLLSAGCRPAGPGEFTRRAFLNGKMDLTRAEAVNELIRARSDRARALALARLGGAVQGAVEDIRRDLVRLSAAVELELDYPDDEIEPPGLDRGLLDRARRKVERLLATYRGGRLIQEGVAVVLAGRTNAGKSSLFNLLLGQERAIVSEIHGTTRDYIEALAVLEGQTCRVFDTAGLRTPEHPLEQEGIRRTQDVLRAADVVVYLVDACRGMDAEDTENLTALGADRVVRVWNKIDLASGSPPDGFIGLSCTTLEGLAEVSRAVVDLVPGRQGLDAHQPVVDSLRQKRLLERCRDSLALVSRGVEEGMSVDLLAVDLRSAVEALGEITGEITTEEILRQMFDTFCVGK